MMMELTLSKSKVEQDTTPVNSGKPMFEQKVATE